MVMPDEKEILIKLNQGDEAGLEGLFSLYYKPLCVFALNFIDSYEEAEDLIQELFVKFWERRGKSSKGLCGRICFLPCSIIVLN